MAARFDYRKLLIDELRDLSQNEAEKVYEAVVSMRDQCPPDDDVGFATDCLAEIEMAALGAY